MKRVLIIGATGTVGGAVRQTLIRETDAHLTLFARHRIVSDNSHEDAVTGDVRDPVSLEGGDCRAEYRFCRIKRGHGRLCPKHCCGNGENRCRPPYIHFFNGDIR